MNPFKLLQRLGHWQALDAVIIRSNGERYALKVKPEEIQDATIAGDYGALVRVRVWSTSDAAAETGEGDVLEVTNTDGSTSRYAATRSPASTRYYDWRFLKNGNRKVFYTRY